jgi:hypothetical protein
MLFGGCIADLGFEVVRDTNLKVGEKIAIANGKRSEWFAIVSASFWQTCGCRFSFRHTKILPAALRATILNCSRKLRA